MYSTRLLLVAVVALLSFWGAQGVDITPVNLQPGEWAYYSLDLTTVPASNENIRGSIVFSLSDPTGQVTIYAQYENNPTLLSHIPLSQEDEDRNGNYFADVLFNQTMLPSLTKLTFGIHNEDTKPVAVAGGRYYFRLSQTLPDPFSVETGTYTVRAGTATDFILIVPEATQLALSVSIKFTTLNAFQKEVSNLLLRLNAIPSIAAHESWGIIDFENPSGTNSKGERVAGWEGWFRKGILSGKYYISLFNSDADNHVVEVKAYLTQIFALVAGTSQQVNAISGKNIVFTYTTDAANKQSIQVNATHPPGATLNVMIQENVCPTTGTYQTWTTTNAITNGYSYTTPSEPSTSYCIVARNVDAGNYMATVVLSQVASGSNNGGGSNPITVTTDEYGDGIEDIEIAGIVLGIFIGIFALFFLVCFILTLVQMDRNYWFDADPLNNKGADLVL